MNIHSRPLVATAAVIATAGLLSACSPGTAATKSGATSASSYKIIDISGPVSDPFFGAVKHGSDDAAKALGVNYTYSASKDYTDVVPMYAKLTEAAISQKPDALVIGDYFPDTLNPLIQKAVAAGIPVFVTNSGREDWQKLGALGFIGENPSAMGEEAGKAAVASGAKSVLCVNHLAGNPVLEQRCKGYTDAVEAAGGTAKNLVIPTDDASNDQKVQQDIAGALQSTPGINAVFTLGSSIATDAVAAVKQAGKTGDIRIGTVDVSNNVLKSVVSGDLDFAVDQQPYLQGYYGVQMAYQYLKFGLKPANAIDSGPLVITKKNAAEVLKVNTEFKGVRGAL